MQEKRNEWKTLIKTLDVTHLCFLDESGVNTDMTRTYGRAQGGELVIGSVPLNTPKSTTILSSVCLKGTSVYTTYSGGTTGEKFANYLKNDLIPTLVKEDIVVMDNLRANHVKEVRETFEDAGIHYLYLPPYSPDMNPIEMLWSKIKSILRKLEIRTAEGLPDAIAFAFQQVSPSDCLGWFSAAGACANFLDCYNTITVERTKV